MIKLFLRERYYLKIDKAASSETSASVSNFHRNLNRQHADGNKVVGNCLTWAFWSL